MADEPSKDKPVEMLTSPPLPPPPLPSASSTTARCTNREGRRVVLMAVQLQQLCQNAQHRTSLIQDQIKQQQQANSNKMVVQAATTAPVLPIPTRKMAVHVADPTLATVSIIPCVDCQPRHCGILSSPKRKSKREARFQGNYSAEERVGGHNRGRDDEEACPTAKV